MFINIEGNIINLNELLYIRKAKLASGLESKPGIQIKIKGDITINLIYNSEEEVNKKLDDTWKSIYLRSSVCLK